MFTPLEQTLFNRAVMHADAVWKAEDDMHNRDHADRSNMPEAVASSCVDARQKRDAVITELSGALQARGQSNYDEARLLDMVEVTSNENRNVTIIDIVFANLGDDEVLEDGVTVRDVRREVRLGSNDAVRWLGVTETPADMPGFQ